jgi:hypothetical protein
MRSFILTAALAAAFVSTLSVTAGYAKSPGTPATRSEHPVGEAVTRPGMTVGDAARPGHPMGESEGQADPVPPVVIYPRGWMAQRTLAPRGVRLVRIETELGHAMHRINADRRLGELTPREARFARNEDRTARAEAIAIARQHDGAIPYPSFAMLQGRVAYLDRQIDREATGRG